MKSGKAGKTAVASLIKVMPMGDTRCPLPLPGDRIMSSRSFRYSLSETQTRVTQQKYKSHVHRFFCAHHGKAPNYKLYRLKKGDSLWLQS